MRAMGRNPTEDEIMQIVVDEHGTGNVIDHYASKRINDDDEILYDEEDDDVIVPTEDQSMKTEAEVGSDIFEGSPTKSVKTIHEIEDISLKSALKTITDQFIQVIIDNPFHIKLPASQWC